MSENNVGHKELVSSILERDLKVAKGHLREIITCDPMLLSILQNILPCLIELYRGLCRARIKSIEVANTCYAGSFKGSARATKIYVDSRRLSHSFKLRSYSQLNTAIRDDRIARISFNPTLRLLYLVLFSLVLVF